MGLITNLVSTYAASKAQEQQMQLQNQTQMINLMKGIISDPNAKPEKKAAASAFIIDVVSKYGGKEGKAQVPQIASALQVLARGPQAQPQPLPGQQQGPVTEQPDGRIARIAPPAQASGVGGSYSFDPTGGFTNMAAPSYAPELMKPKQAPFRQRLAQFAGTAAGDIGRAFGRPETQTFPEIPEELRGSYLMTPEEQEKEDMRQAEVAGRVKAAAMTAEGQATVKWFSDPKNHQMLRDAGMDDKAIQTYMQDSLLKIAGVTPRQPTTRTLSKLVAGDSEMLAGMGADPNENYTVVIDAATGKPLEIYKAGSVGDMIGTTGKQLVWGYMHPPYNMDRKQAEAQASIDLITKYEQGVASQGLQMKINAGLAGLELPGSPGAPTTTQTTPTRPVFKPPPAVTPAPTTPTTPTAPATSAPQPDQTVLDPGTSQERTIAAPQPAPVTPTAPAVKPAQPAAPAAKPAAAPAAPAARQPAQQPAPTGGLTVAGPPPGGYRPLGTMDQWANAVLTQPAPGGGQMLNDDGVKAVLGLTLTLVPGLTGTRGGAAMSLGQRNTAMKVAEIAKVPYSRVPEDAASYRGQMNGVEQNENYEAGLERALAQIDEFGKLVEETSKQLGMKGGPITNKPWLEVVRQTSGGNEKVEQYKVSLNAMQRAYTILTASALQSRGMPPVTTQTHMQEILDENLSVTRMLAAVNQIKKEGVKDRKAVRDAINFNKANLDANSISIALDAGRTRPSATGAPGATGGTAPPPGAKYIFKDGKLTKVPNQ